MVPRHGGLSALSDAGAAGYLWTKWYWNVGVFLEGGMPGYGASLQWMISGPARLWGEGCHGESSVPLGWGMPALGGGLSPGWSVSVQGLNCLSSAGGCLPLPFPQPHCPQTCPERARLGHGAAGSCTPDARSFSLSARRAGTGIATTAKRSFWFVFFFSWGWLCCFLSSTLTPAHESSVVVVVFRLEIYFGCENIFFPRDII